MTLEDFEALSFDCYGTLIDWEAGIAAVLGPWARENGLHDDDEALLTAYAEQEARVEAEHPQALYPEVLARSFTALAADLGRPLAEQDADRLATSVPDWPPFADTVDALAALAQRYKLIILSNVDRASFAGSNARLGVVFDAVVTAEDVGSYKPSPQNFTALAEAATGLGVGPGRLLHVAQSLFHDHVPAKRAGLATVWINRRHDRPGWGATPQPRSDVRPDWEFPSMAAFARACTAR
jgi:putative hydrolase of the HAD superfamily